MPSIAGVRNVSHGSHTPNDPAPCFLLLLPWGHPTQKRSPPSRPPPRTLPGDHELPDEDEESVKHEKPSAAELVEEALRRRWANMPKGSRVYLQAILAAEEARLRSRAKTP